MKNTGLTIAITIAVLALLAGGYFMLNKTKVEPEIGVLETINMQKDGPNSPTPTGTKTGTDSSVDIDAELKSLDTDMSSAFEKDSDSDPSLGI